MFPLPLQTDNEQLSPDDVADGTMDYGRIRGRTFRGIIDFGDAALDARWTADYQRYLAAGMPEATARQLANIANFDPVTGMPGQYALQEDVGQKVAAAVAQKQAQDAQLKAQAANAAAQGVKIGTDVASQQIAAEQAKQNAKLTPGGGVVYDAKTGQPITVAPTGGGAKSESNTAMYVGAAAVLLGLGFVAMRKNRGSLGGYSRRHRKSRKSRRSRR